MAHARSHAPRHRVAPVPGRGTARSTAGCTNSTAAEVERCLPKAAGNCNSNSKAAHAVPRPILINPITCPSRCLPRSQTSSSIQRSCSSLAGQSCEGYDTRPLRRLLPRGDEFRTEVLLHTGRFARISVPCNESALIRLSYSASRRRRPRPTRWSRRRMHGSISAAERFGPRHAPCLHPQARAWSALVDHWLGGEPWPPRRPRSAHSKRLLLPAPH